MPRILYISLTLLVCVQVLKGQTQMPIIGYSGIPYHKASDEAYKEMKECGFTVNVYPYFPSLASLQHSCMLAERNGMQVMGPCPEILDNPVLAAKTLKNENGLFGYFIKDEPKVDEMAGLQNIIEKLKAIDNTHRFYINLCPYLKASGIASVADRDEYITYVNALAQTSCQQISFDHYPITKYSIKPTWYHNLEIIHNASIRYNKPFWGFVLSTPHHVYPMPTMGSLRLQIYSNLAYGAQAIQYFTYWNPSVNEGYDFHAAAITNDGKKTSTYFLLQKMNRELQKIAPLFYGAKVMSVYHVGKIPIGTTRLTKLPRNIRLLRVDGKEGAIVSQLEKDGRKYIVIVNKDYSSKMKLHIEKANEVPVCLNSDLTVRRMDSNYSIPAGGIVVFRIS